MFKDKRVKDRFLIISKYINQLIDNIQGIVIIFTSVHIWHFP